MALHDLVKDGEIVEGPEDFAETPVDMPTNKGAWLPRFYPNPDFAPGPDQRTVTTVAIEADRVVYAFAGEDRPLDALKAEFSAAVMSRRDAEFARHYRPSAGPLAGKALACRTDEDRTNWLTMRARWKDAIGAGAGALEQARFRTVANETVLTSFDAGVAYLDAMTDWGASIYDRSWALKDAAAAAADLPALQAVRADLDDGWPA